MSEYLYAISSRYAEILSVDADDPDARAALVAALDEAQGDFTEKAEAIVKFIRNCEGDILALLAEEKRLAEKRRVLENKVKNLTAYIEAMMMITGQRAIKAGIFDLKFRQNQPSISIIDLAAVPREYFIAAEPELSKQAIKDAIKAGVTVPGVEIIRNERLVIK